MSSFGFAAPIGDIEGVGDDSSRSIATAVNGKNSSSAVPSMTDEEVDRYARYDFEYFRGVGR